MNDYNKIEYWEERYSKYVRFLKITVYKNLKFL